MQRIEPIPQAQRSSPRRGGLGVLLACCLVLAALAGLAARTRTVVERLVAGPYEDALVARDRVHGAAATLAHLRADRERVLTPTDEAERERLAARAARSRSSLIGDLRTVAASARSLRVSQAALAAQDAVAAWDEAAGSRADLDRLASIAEAQLRTLERLVGRDGLDLRRRVQADVVEAVVQLVAGFAAAGFGVLGLGAWWLRRRRRRTRAVVTAGRSPAVEPAAADLRPAPPAPARSGEALSAAESSLMPAFGQAADRHLPAGERCASGLGAAEASLQTALDTMSQGLCLYDAAHRLVVFNRRYTEIYNLGTEALRCGMTARDVIAASLRAGNHPGRTLDQLLGEAEQILRTGDQGDHFQEVVGGRVLQIRACRTAEGGLVATYEDVTERWHAEARIAYMARHDALTDLPNRLLLAERIAGAITQASREHGFAVHCLDLDDFKRVNDTLGHAVGDELLRAVAHRLAACLRDCDTVARLGGDEFAIIQADVDGEESAVVLARHVIEVVSAPYTLTDHCVSVGLSIGVALAPAHGMDADRLLKNGDVALYRAKSDGRGIVRFFEPEMDARLQARRLLELDLRAAIAAEAFELHYQPIYDLAQERICGFEALLRWTHPTRGRVSPAEFVPLAEEIGLIVPLGEWVLRRACEEAAGWPDDLKIAVNVSPAQFGSARLIGAVRETLDRTGLAPHRLELEITETVLLANRAATVAILHALRTIGTRIAMDDFGTGYSSLSYLRSFPFDKMKIDQSFIRDLTTENGSGFIVRAVISLGSSLGMTTTAEGVETAEQLARLREEGCDEVQGYLFSPPVPAAEVPALLDRWNRSARPSMAA